MINVMKEQKLLMAFLIAMAVALAMTIAFHPIPAHAKAQGDAIGAPTKGTTTGVSRADMADATTTPATSAAIVATTTVQKAATAKVSTVSNDDAERIALLKQQIALLQQLIKLLSK